MPFPNPFLMILYCPTSVRAVNSVPLVVRTVNTPTAVASPLGSSVPVEPDRASSVCSKSLGWRPEGIWGRKVSDPGYRYSICNSGKLMAD